MTQRRWLSLWMLILIAAPVMAAEPRLLLGPMLGHVDAHSARIWIRSDRAAELDVTLSRNPDLSDAHIANGPSLQAASNFCGMIHVENLEPGTRYYYAVMLDGRRITPVPYPSFLTTVEPDVAGRQRIAFSSCNGHSGNLAAAAWTQMDVTPDLDLVLNLGDNHYADTTEPDKLRDAYLDHRRAAGFRSLSARVPFYGIWDDHDFGPNNSDRTTEGKADSLRVFKEHWANPAYGETSNPGVYFTFARGGVRIIMLDVRYHRDPNNTPADPAKTMLGSRQKAWLKATLENAKEKLILMATGSEFQPHGHIDSWKSFEHERQEILSFLRTREIRGVILLSGDRHFSAAYQIDQQIIEVTAGPMGSKTYASPAVPGMFMLQNAGKLFAVLDVDTRPETPKVFLEFHRAGDGQVARRELTWDEITGKQKIQMLPAP